MNRSILAIFTILSASLLPAWTPTLAQSNFSSQQNINVDIELLRSDVRASKNDILVKTMNLTETQAAAFWPIYRSYDYEYSKIIDERIALIRTYTYNYDNLPQEKARQLVEKSFKLNEQKNSLNKKYFKEFIKVVPLNTAARFFQVENQLDQLIELQISSQLPLVK